MPHLFLCGRNADFNLWLCMAQVIERAEACWAAEGDKRALAPRVSFARGDFFVPATMPAPKVLLLP